MQLQTCTIDHQLDVQVNHVNNDTTARVNTCNT